jgi:peptide/nickel transport system permease protein
MVVVFGLVFMGIFAPYLAPFDPIKQSLGHREFPPTWGLTVEAHNYPDDNPSHIDRMRYLLGADHLGRDVLSRVIQGARISVQVVGIALVTGVLVGATMGLMAGYYGGWTDEFITRTIDMWNGLPFILIALVVSVVLGTSTTVVMFLLALLAWTPFVRQVRADALVLKTRDYIAAARIAGAGDFRIMLRHIFPGTVSTVMVVASLRVGGLILAEASLSFLGAGIPDPIPAWGKSVSEGRRYLGSSWWISFFPGLAIFLVVMSLNFFGDWLRDRLDPRLRQLG